MKFGWSGEGVQYEGGERGGVKEVLCCAVLCYVRIRERRRN